MGKPIEDILLKDHAAMYSAIMRKNEETLNLPVKITHGFVFFGHVLDFSMFWISSIRGNLLFGARKKFTRSRKDNIVHLDFTEENLDAMLSAIDTICDSYTASLTNGGMAAERDRIQRKRERRIERRAAHPKPSDATPFIQSTYKEILDKVDFSIAPDCIDEKNSEQYEIYGRRIVELFDEIFHILGKSKNEELLRNSSIYYEYIDSDKATLAMLGQKYGLSRERIRQIVNKAGNTMHKRFRRAVRYENSYIQAQTEEIASILEKTNYELISLVIFGMTDVSKRKKEALLSTLFGEKAAEKSMEAIRSVENGIKEQKSISEQNKKLNEELDHYRSKVCYPSIAILGDSLLRSAYSDGFSSSAEDRFHKKITKFESIIKIVRTPDIVYYSSPQTDHRPSFLLQFPDQTNVLVLIMNTINLAFVYNVQRCNELHRFCKENGYGYLIMDDRGNSIYDLMNRDLDSELENILNGMLDSYSMITWEHIKDIKLTRPVPNDDIVTYVLKNKLHFTMSPFCIKRRQNY